MYKTKSAHGDTYKSWDKVDPVEIDGRIIVKPLKTAFGLRVHVILSDEAMKQLEAYRDSVQAGVPGTPKEFENPLWFGIKPSDEEALFALYPQGEDTRADSIKVCWQCVTVKAGKSTTKFLFLVK